MRKFSQASLIVQMAVFVTLVSIACVALITAVTYYTVRETLEHETLTQVDRMAKGLDNVLQRWLEEQQQGFAAIVTDPEFSSRALELLRQPQGQQAQGAAYAYLKQLFNRHVAVRLSLSEVSLLSKRGGEVLVSSDPRIEGQFQADRQFFHRGLKAPSVHPLYTRVATLEPSMTLSTPVKDTNDVVEGVLAIHLDLKSLTKSLASHPEIYSIGNAYLVDRSHVPVGYYKDWAEEYPRGLHSEGIDAAIAGRSGVGIYRDYRGQEVVGSYQWLERFGVVLVVEVAKREAFSLARYLGGTIFTIGLLGGGFLSLAMTLLVRKAIRPVLAVSQAAQVVASGDLQVPELPPGPAEFGVLVASFNDMVQQINALVEDVREREERYRQVFNATDEAIFIHAGDSNRVLDYNDAAQRIFALGENEQLYDIAELSAGYPPYAREDVLEKLQSVHNEGPQLFEWRSRRRNGELFWSEVMLSAMTISGERNILAVVRDIDQRKHNEAELAAYRKNLEWTIEERSKQLQEAQEALVNQEKLAVLGQLTATVSHELRNPLGTMSNALYALEAALDLGASDKARTSLAMVDRSLRRCDKIIGELLDFTRRHENEVVATQIDHWLHGLLEEFRLPEEITLQEELTCGVEVQIDQESMRRAMINLLDNAVQAMQTASACGTLLTVGTFIKEGALEIRISDQGPGIPEEHRKAIFEPLFSTKEFGVGLGVPIIQNVVEKQGGRLDYYCPPGGGTVAVVTLPVST